MSLRDHYLQRARESAELFQPHPVDSDPARDVLLRAIGAADRDVVECSRQIDSHRAHVANAEAAMAKAAVRRESLLDALMLLPPPFPQLTGNAQQLASDTDRTGGD